jgi:hypothetical protein
LSLGELSDPERVARAAGFVAGELYVEKKSKHIYRLTSVAADSVFTKESLWEEQSKLTINIEDLTKTFVKFQGQLQEKLEGWSDRVMSTSLRVTADRLKATALHAIADKANHTEQGGVKLVFCINPSEVRAATAIAKGKLELVPAGLLNNIVSKKPIGSKCVDVTVGDSTVWVVEPSRPRNNDASDWKYDVMLVPFWWVSTTDDPKAANMVEKRFVDKDRGVSFVVLVNSRQVKAMEKLCMYKQNTAADGGATFAASEPKRLRST